MISTPSVLVDEKASQKGLGGASSPSRKTLLDRWRNPVIPPELQGDPETARHALLITQFGQLGTIFGLLYAAFYLLIEHYWGALIVGMCTSGVLVTPALMRLTKSISLAGNFFSMTLVLGFLGLSLVEGGVHGHAIAWLVSVPLCALILLGQREAITWVVISFMAAALVTGLDLAGIQLPTTYDAKWNSLISAAGYLGLVLFMFILGLIFERGRAQSQMKMEAALKELATSNERLVYLNSEKSEFLGIAAHDLRVPLTIILGNAEMIQIIKDPAKTGELVGAIMISVERMRDLINNLLDVNTIEEGKFASKIESCDIGMLTRQCIQYQRAAAEKKQITIDDSRVLDVYASADIASTAQILDNLVSNAIKYSPKNTTIYISSGRDQKNAFVSVRDEGPGISAEDQKKLFKKFSRLTARPTGGESTTGLGLAIVKRLAEAMSGSIKCESELGEGSTFTLRVPFLAPGVSVKMAPGATSTAKLRWEARRPKV
jgi:signal transduction histidine kinase